LVVKIILVEDILWARVRNNEKAAFTEMYKAYYQFLFSIGFRICADKDLTKDCIHDMFLEIWHNRENLPQVQHVGFYLKTYLRRKISKEVPRLKNIRQAGTSDSEINDIQYSYEDILIALQSQDEMKEKVKVAIQKLTKSQLEVIRMKFFDDKSYLEIATYKATTARTIYNQVYQALKTLRQYLKILLIAIQVLAS
jgi:RNA polymerase sigma-70 factor (ECF subfamily)